MTKEMYIEQRNALLGEIEALIADGKIEESGTKMADVEALDNQYEQAKLANANLQALRGAAPVIDLENKSVVVTGETKIETTGGLNMIDEKQIYTNAWAKAMQGVALDDKEQNIFDSVNTEFSNAYTHDTGNTSVLIPETVVAGIWARAAEMYPLLADVKKFNVKGTLTMKKTFIN